MSAAARALTPLALLLAACGESAPAAGVGTGHPPAPERVALRYSAPGAGAPRYERVVFVTIDTLRADHLGCYGYVRDTSPFLDSLAARGTRFERAMAPISHTGPSHASMLTGMPPTRHGLRRNGERLHGQVPTAAAPFAAAGYDTAAFLSTHFLAAVAQDFAHVVAGEQNATGVVDGALRWLRDEREGDRFLLWLHFFEPHRWVEPAKCPPEDIAAVVASHERRGLDFLEHLIAQHDLGIEPGEEFRLDLRMDRGERFPTNDPAEYVRRIDAYDGQIHFADRELGRFFAAFEELDLPGRTLWIVTADHGEGLGQHRRLGHGRSVYNEQLHVPLIVYASDGSLAGEPIAELVQLVDLAPTLAATVGASLEGNDPVLDGASLWPLLERREGWTSRPAFAERKPARGEAWTDLFALQSEEFKYLLKRDGPDEFFDLTRDPTELVNRIGEPSDVRDSFERLLESRVERCEGSVGTPGDQEIPEEWLEELKKLGYVY